MTIENRKIESSDLLEYSASAKDRRSIRKEVVQMKKIGEWNSDHILRFISKTSLL